MKNLLIFSFMAFLLVSCEGKIMNGAKKVGSVITFPVPENCILIGSDFGNNQTKDKLRVILNDTVKNKIDTVVIYKKNFYGDSPVSFKYKFFYKDK
jgi:hypothetical protein